MAGVIYNNIPEFKPLDIITADILNDYFRNNIDFLRDENYTYIVLTEDILATTSLVALSESEFTIETSGGGIEIEVNVNVNNSSASSRIITFDFLLDGTLYVSSGTGTPLDNGVYYSGVLANFPIMACFKVYIPPLDPGVHTLRLAMKANAASALTLTGSTTLATITAREVGINP